MSGYQRERTDRRHGHLLGHGNRQVLQCYHRQSQRPQDHQDTRRNLHQCSERQHRGRRQRDGHRHRRQQRFNLGGHHRRASHTISIATATVSGGSWSVSGIDASGLTDGTVTYSATETNAVGNTNTITQNKTKNTFIPTVAFTTTPNINIANHTSVTATGTGDSGDDISVVIHDAASHTTIASTTTVSGGSWSVSGMNASAIDSNGTVTYAVTETDGVGNHTTVMQYELKITVAPAETFTSTPNINIANVTSFTVSGTGDGTDAISLVITDNSTNTISATTTVSGGSWSVSGINASGLTDGPVTYSAIETNAVGNSTTLTQSETKITLAPSLSVTSALYINGANVGNVTVSGTGNGVSISVVIADQWLTSTTMATTTVSGGSWSVSGIDASGLDDGPIAYTVTETDAAGNTTTASPRPRRNSAISPSRVPRTSTSPTSVAFRSAALRPTTMTTTATRSRW